MVHVMDGAEVYEGQKEKRMEYLGDFHAIGWLTNSLP